MMQRTAYGLSNRLSPDGSMRPNLSHEEVYFDRLPPFLTRQEERVMFALRECYRAACDLHLPAGVALQDWLCRRVPQEAQELSQIWSPSFTLVFDSAPPPPPPLPPPQQHDSKLSGKRHCVDLHQQPPAKQSRTMATKDQRTLDAVSGAVGGKASVSQKGKGKINKRYDQKVEAYLSTLPEGEFNREQRIDKETRENMQKESFEKFFASLPGDSFLDEELSLREELLEFLHRRAEEDPNIAPTVSDAKNCVPSIKNLCTRFLPLGVGLKDWIECRIAEEVEVSWDESRSCSVLVLLDVDQPDHQSDQLDQPDQPDRLDHPDQPDQSRRLDQPVRGDVGGKASISQKGKGKKKRYTEKMEAYLSTLPEGEFNREQLIDAETRENLRRESFENFFASLPEDSFLEEEISLREALIEFLHRRAEEDPHTAPTVTDAKKCVPSIQKLCTSFFPLGVGLKDWVECRIADEVEVSCDEARGRHSVLKLLDAVSGDVGGKGKGAQKGFRKGIDEKRSPEQIEAFVSALPEGEFTADELRLREALFEFLDRYEKQHPGVAPRIVDAKSERGRVAWCCRRVLPERVGLGDWIRHRLAEEVITEWDEERHCTVLVRVHDV